MQSTIFLTTVPGRHMVRILVFHIFPRYPRRGLAAIRHLLIRSVPPCQRSSPPPPPPQHARAHACVRPQAPTLTHQKSPQQRAPTADPSPSDPEDPYMVSGTHTPRNILRPFEGRNYTKGITGNFQDKPRQARDKLQSFCLLRPCDPQRTRDGPATNTRPQKLNQRTGKAPGTHMPTGKC